MMFFSRKARDAVKEAKRKEAESFRRALLAEDMMALLRKPEEPKFSGMAGMLREYYGDAEPQSLFHRIKQIADQEFKTSLDAQMKWGELSKRLTKEKKAK